MRAVIPAALLLAAWGCAGPRPAPDRVVRWSGEVRITDDVVLARGTRLVVEPGTRVRFAFRDDDGDGWGDASVRIEGDLEAVGTPDAPIVFTADAAPATPGRWGEIRVDFGRIRLERCIVEGSTRGLHAHFSRGAVRNSVFRRNIDGTRLGNSEIVLEKNLFYANPGKAYNAHRCRNRVAANRFHHNGKALFLFEADGGSAFTGNRFRQNETDLRPGDFFTGTVNAPANDWGGPLPAPPADNPAVTIRATQAPVPWAGPEGWAGWDERWAADPGGFVDAPARPADEGVYAASWAGGVVRVGVLDGAIRAEARVPDVVDAAPALGPGVVAVWAWDRGLYLLGRPDLRPLDRAESAPSPQDDHRQSAPVFSGTRLFAAGWDGRVRAFETAGGRLGELWTFPTGGAVRAPLTLAGGLLLVPCQDGRLYALDPATGRPRWAYGAGAPLLSGTAVVDGMAVAADRDGRVHAVALATGTPRWTAELGAPAWYAGAAAAGGLVFQGDDGGRLHALDAATGALRWTTPLEGGIRSRPLPLGERDLAAVSLGGWVYLLDRSNGIERDAWPVGPGAQADPAAAGEFVFVGTRRNGLLCLERRRW